MRSRLKHTPLRFIGISLSGAKNAKTSMSVLEHYPKEKKTFLLDIYEGISGEMAQDSDEALLEILHESKTHLETIAVNVSAELPPCISCKRKQCPLPIKCTVPEVKWMRDFLKKANRDFTPYTQRPVEIWLRHAVIPLLKLKTPMDLDETLGGTRAPLVARHHFLNRHFPKVHRIEVNPKINVRIMGQNLGLSLRLMDSYRDLERGEFSRSEILESLSRKHSIFIYERDQRKLSQSLGSFDGFISALTGLLDYQNLCVAAPERFPIASGWVTYPKFSSS